jgi:hypothetical protein
MGTRLLPSRGMTVITTSPESSENKGYDNGQPGPMWQMLRQWAARPLLPPLTTGTQLWLDCLTMHTFLPLPDSSVLTKAHICTLAEDGLKCCLQWQACHIINLLALPSILSFYLVYRGQWPAWLGIPGVWACGLQLRYLFHLSKRFKICEKAQHKLRDTMSSFLVQSTQGKTIMKKEWWTKALDSGFP